MSAFYKGYDFFMTQILKLRHIFDFLFENGYLFIIILVLFGIFLHFLLYQVIKLKSSIEAALKSKENKNNKE